MNTCALGVCYYPEQWPQDCWAEDLARIKALGLTYIRLAEFAWSRMEPEPGHWDWAWLDQVLEMMQQHGLRAVLGTPTATPPKWLVDLHPEILPMDEEGRVRRFGSRRHTCFSNPLWLQHSERIVRALAGRYGAHPVVAGWQTDNEYGCHDTVRCYCPRCREAFQEFLQARYGTCEALNQAWGTAFWSQTYRAFQEVDLPCLTVTEAHPALRLDYFRFASSQVVAYNRRQVELLRSASPGRFITHNFMGYFDALDAFALGEDLDLASWDNYPLGFTSRLPLSPKEHLDYARSGHPEVGAWHHDLYRRAGKGRWWVMEQQPGPVNWGASNPAPSPGMVRLWTWEALAHGAECVSYFRWRQARCAQEQMHAGLLFCDGQPSPYWGEVEQVVSELRPLPPVGRSPVALVYDFEAAWVSEIQPHGEGWSYPEVVRLFYGCLRELGLDVDVVGRQDSLAGYPLVVAPSLPILTPEERERMSQAGCCVFGPRSASKTPEMAVALDNPFGVRQVESLPPGLEDEVLWEGRSYPVRRWRELAHAGEVLATFGDGQGALFGGERCYYLAFWPDPEFLKAWLTRLATHLGLAVTPLPPGLRLRRRGNWSFAFNYTGTVQRAPAGPEATYHLGGPEIAPYSLAAWSQEEKTGARTG